MRNPLWVFGSLKVHTATFRAPCGPFAPVAVPACFPFEVFWNANRFSFPSFSSPSLLQIPPPATSGSWRLKCGSWRTTTTSFSRRWGAHIQTLYILYLNTAYHRVALWAQSCTTWTHTLTKPLMSNFPTRPKHVIGSCDEIKSGCLMHRWSHPLTTACLLVGEYVYPCLIHIESVSFSSERWC